MVTTKQILAAAKKKSAAIAKEKALEKKRDKEWKAWIAKKQKEEAKRTKDKDKFAKSKLKAEEKIAGAKAKVKAKKSAARAKVIKKVAKDVFKDRGTLKGGPLTKGIAKAFGRAMKPLPRRIVPVRRAPARQAPMRRPVAVSRAPVKRVIMAKQQSSALPASVRQLQHTPNIKRFLTPAERAEVESGMPGLMRFNAMQIIKKKILAKEKALRGIKTPTHKERYF